MTDFQVQIDVSFDVAADRVAVSTSDWHASCTVVVQRSAGIHPAAHIPIGTRDPAHLTMTVNGRAAELAPSTGGVTRGSYRVTVVLDRVTYQLKPSSSTESRLTRDDARIGEFSHSGTGEVKAWWAAGAEVSPTDAAVGYALAAAFGTGKKFFLVALLEDGSAQTSA